MRGSAGSAEIHTFVEARLDRERADAGEGRGVGDLRADGIKVAEARAARYPQLPGRAGHCG